MNITVANFTNKTWVFISEDQCDDVWCLGKGREYKIYIPRTNTENTTFHSYREAMGQIKKFFKVKTSRRVGSYPGEKYFTGYLK